MRTVVSRRHGLDARLLDDLEPTPLVCDCDNPRPERLDGIWYGLALYECRRCGRKVVT